MLFTVFLLADNNQTSSDNNYEDNSTVTLKQNGKSFYIKKEILAKYDDLTKMILATESMDDSERQYWFSLMPSMGEEHIDRLYQILDTERKKLQELEIKYQDEIKSLNEKHLVEWSSFQIKENKNLIHKKEGNTSNTDFDKILDRL